MINQRKIDLMKKIGIGIGVAFVPIVLIFWFLTNQGRSGQIEQASTDSTVLSEELVTDFLKAYLTKEKTGSNREQYKPFFTKQGYQVEVAKEEEPSNKLYTDYMTDYHFKEAEVYLGTSEPIAYVKAHYSYTAQNQTVDTNGKYQSQEFDNTWQMKLTFEKVDGHYLIKQIETVNLDPIEEGDTDD